MSNSPLEGIRILGLTWVWSGPWLGAMLSDMGAEVIRIESNQRIESGRLTPPFAGGEPGLNRSLFNFVNRGVMSCTLNLKQPKALEIFKDLVRISDVVITNFAPRVLPSWGIDYAMLKEVKPDIIFVSLPGFGNTGPDKDYVSYASVAQGVGGFASSFGYTDGDPELGGIHPADPVGALYGLVCTLGALYYRNETGKGQYVDLAQSEAITTLIPEVVMEYTMSGRIRPRMANRDEIMAPHNCYRCKGEDKWVAIAVGTDEEWRALCWAMGNPEWSQDDGFSDQYSRWQNQDKLDKLITEWTKNLTHYEVMRKLQEAGVAAGPSFNAAELVNEPHLKERGAFIQQNHPEAGKTIVYRSSWASAVNKDIPPAPCFGEHNSYVFKELLGITDEDFDQLVGGKIIY